MGPTPGGSGNVSAFTYPIRQDLWTMYERDNNRSPSSFHTHPIHYIVDNCIGADQEFSILCSRLESAH